MKKMHPQAQATGLNSLLSRLIVVLRSGQKGDSLKTVKARKDSRREHNRGRGSK